METEKRLRLIKIITEHHPGNVQMANNKFAWYTGGMKDTGDFYWKYLLFEASIRDLEAVLERLGTGPKYTQIQ